MNVSDTLKIHFGKCILEIHFWKIPYGSCQKAMPMAANLVKVYQFGQPICEVIDVNVSHTLKIPFGKFILEIHFGEFKLENSFW